MITPKNKNFLLEYGSEKIHHALLDDDLTCNHIKNDVIRTTRHHSVIEKVLKDYPQDREKISFLTWNKNLEEKHVKHILSIDPDYDETLYFRGPIKNHKYLR